MNVPPLSQPVWTQIETALQLRPDEDNNITIDACGNVDPFVANRNSSNLLRDVHCDFRNCKGKGLEGHKLVRVSDVRNYLGGVSSHNVSIDRLSLVSADLTHFLENNPSNQPRILMFPCNIAYERNDGRWDPEKGWQKHRTGVVLKTLTRFLNDKHILKEEKFNALLDIQEKNARLETVIHVELPDNRCCLKHLFIFPLHEHFSSTESLSSQYTMVRQALKKMATDAHVALIPPAMTNQYNESVPSARELNLQMAPLLSSGSGVSVVCYPGGPEYSSLQCELKEGPIKSMVASLFVPPLRQYGLRGDEVLWNLLEARFRQVELPQTEDQMKKLVEKELGDITGVNFLRWRSGGHFFESLRQYTDSSKEMVASLEFWKEDGMHKLLERYRNLLRNGNGR